MCKSTDAMDRRNRRVRLELRKETLRRLADDELGVVAGGALPDTCTCRASGCSASVTQHPWNQNCCY